MLDRRSGPNGNPLKVLLPIALLWAIMTPPFQGCGGYFLESDHICLRRGKVHEPTVQPWEL
jgi:hypothetical protein